MQVVVVESDHLDASRRRELRTLWDEAFCGRFSDDDAEHAWGGVHVVATEDTVVVGHASVVPRRIRFGTQPWRTVGYVEAVATRPDRQHAGIGRRTMQVLHEEIAARWPLALLSTGRAAGFYEQLGWQRWVGTSLTRTSSGVVPDGEHGGLMVLRVDPATVIDLSVAVTCEDRSGDAW